MHPKRKQLKLKSTIHFLYRRLTRSLTRTALLLLPLLYLLIALIFGSHEQPLVNDPTLWERTVALFTFPKIWRSRESKLWNLPGTPREAADLFQRIFYNTTNLWTDEYKLKENLLTVRLGPKRGKTLRSIDELEFYDSDPRLVYTTYFNHLVNIPQAQYKDHDFAIPFSWYDFADFHNYNKLVSIKEDFRDNITCSLLFTVKFDPQELEAFEGKIGTELFHVDRENYRDAMWVRSKKSVTRAPAGFRLRSHCREMTKRRDTRFNLPMNVTYPYPRTRAEVYQIQARNHLLNTVPHPISLTYLEGGDAAYRIDVLPRSRPMNIVQSGMLAGFIERERQAGNTNPVFNPGEQFQAFIDSDISRQFKVNIPETDKDAYLRPSYELSIADFEFDAEAKVRELESIPEEQLTRHQRSYLNSLRNSLRTHPALCPKYFFECAQVAQIQGLGFHRDRRFFNGAIRIGEPQYLNRLNALIRTFQKFLRANGLISWLSHGTLYGYLYDGLTFPWDSDFDLQMPIKHLHYLSEHFNQTIVLEDPREGNGRYYLDVGDSITVRTKGNGMNNIDARFIDIDSGMYIDITGLSVSSEPINTGKEKFFTDSYYSAVKEADVIMHPSEDDIKRVKKTGYGLADMDHEEIKEYVDSHELDFNPRERRWVEKYHESLTTGLDNSDSPSKDLDEVQQFLFNEKLKMVNCRNRHFDRLDMISPLRTSKFHGVDVFVPFKILKSLRSEYNVASLFDFTVYRGRIFLPGLYVWVDFSDLKQASNLGNRDKDLFPVYSPLSSLHIPDLLSLLRNMILKGKNYSLSVICTSFDMAVYRLKEIEIWYDSHIDAERKRQYLHTLKEYFGNDISSPGKDPIMYEYDMHKWRRYVKQADPHELEQVVMFVQHNAVNDLWGKLNKIFDGNFYKRYSKENPEEVVADLDGVGMDLFYDIKEEGSFVFEDDQFF